MDQKRTIEEELQYLSGRVAALTIITGVLFRTLNLRDSELRDSLRRSFDRERDELLDFPSDGPVNTHARTGMAECLEHYAVHVFANGGS